MDEVDAGNLIEQGSLLVADPSMSDPNFRRTVVYLVHHGPEGTLGVVLNRPGDLPVEDVLPDWADHVAEPASVFIGGPVERDTPLCLATLRNGEVGGSVPGTIGVCGPVALVVLDADPRDIAPKVRGLRVFAGYAGWDAGQLDAELSRGDWIVQPGLPDDVLATPQDDLWARVLRRQGLPTALLATHPGELQLN